MQVPTIWNRLSWVVVALLFVAGALAVGSWYLPEIQRNEELQAERLRLEREVFELRARGDALRADLHSLTNDPVAIERILRERFGLAKPGETVVHFEAPTSNPPMVRR